MVYFTKQLEQFWRQSDIPMTFVYHYFFGSYNGVIRSVHSRNVDVVIFCLLCKKLPCMQRHDVSYAGCTPVASCSSLTTPHSKYGTWERGPRTPRWRSLGPTRVSSRVSEWSPYPGRYKLTPGKNVAIVSWLPNVMNVNTMKNSFDHDTVVPGCAPCRRWIILTQTLFVVFQGAGTDWRSGCTSRCPFFESDHRDSSARM